MAWTRRFLRRGGWQRPGREFPEWPAEATKGQSTGSDKSVGRARNGPAVSLLLTSSLTLAGTPDPVREDPTAHPLLRRPARDIRTPARNCEIDGEAAGV